MTDPPQRREAEDRTDRPAATAAPETGLSWPSRGLAAIGWVVLALGALGAMDRIDHFAGPVPWMKLAMWMVGPALAHDLIIGPIATVVAVALARVVPGRFRGPIAGGLIVSACLAAVSWPRLSGYGALPDNSSVVPGNAARDLGLVLGLVWAGVLLTLVVRLLRPPAGAGSGPDRVVPVRT